MDGEVTLLNTVSLDEFTDLVTREFSMVQEMVETGIAQALFIRDDIASHTGDKRSYKEIDTQTFGKLKREGENAAKAKVGVGYEKQLTVRRFAMEIDITHEMRKYNKYPEVTGELTSLTQFCPQRMELDLTHRFTFCTSTSYTDMDGETVDVSVGDGLSLANAAHTLKYSSTTFRNRVSGDPTISQGALEAAETLGVTDIKNNFGDRRIKRFNTIVTSDDPNTCNTVKQILQSTADIDGGHDGVKNVYMAKYRHVELPYLATTSTGANDTTKSKWWFLVAAGQGIMGWQAYFAVAEMPNLKSPAPGNNGEDMHNDNWTYGTRCAYGIAAPSAKGFIASCPTS